MLSTLMSKRAYKISKDNPQRESLNAFICIFMCLQSYPLRKGATVVFIPSMKIVLLSMYTRKVKIKTISLIAGQF